MVSRFGELRIVAPPGVYRPRSDTAMLAEHLGDLTGARVLELCSGSGALALTAVARGAAGVVAVDRCARAVAAIRLNGWLNRLPVDARRGDLLDALRPGERFDVIVANPPYVPVDPAVTRTDPRWDAGADGREVLDRIVDGAPGRLAPGGRLVLVQSDVADSDATCRHLERHGLGTVERHRRSGPLGPILQARREHLTHLGVLDGPTETLSVISARAV
jgi:release factor glutamine methyltransferase